MSHLRDSAPGQHSTEKMSLRWRAVGNPVSDLAGPGIEPQTSRTHYPQYRVIHVSRKTVSRNDIHYPQ